MCFLCENARASSSLSSKISSLLDLDKKAVSASVSAYSEFEFEKPILYTNLKTLSYPISPMFDAKLAFASPNSFFQPIYVNEKKLSSSFSHLSSRSMFFHSGRLLLLSKHSYFKEGNVRFSSYLYVGFRLEDLDFSLSKSEGIKISFSGKKKLINLATSLSETVSIRFSFVHKPINRSMIMDFEEFRRSLPERAERLISLFGKSFDLPGYVVPVPHFSPHPYMLSLFRELGFESPEDLQLSVFDYFSNHLK